MEPWKGFYNKVTGEEMGAYTIRETFPGEEEDTKALLAARCGISTDQITTEIKFLPENTQKEGDA